MTRGGVKPMKSLLLH